MISTFPRLSTVACILAVSFGLGALAACSVSPRYRRGSANGTEVTVGDRTLAVEGRDVVEEAQTYLGAPYRNGGTTASGLDCSGLVYTVFGSLGIALPRTSLGQSTFGMKVSRAELLPGDLVFFHTGKGGRVSHVGIYAGSGQFIHASTRSRRVKFDSLDNKYFRTRYVTARRVL